MKKRITAAAYMNETTKKVRRVLDSNAKSRDLKKRPQLLVKKLLRFLLRRMQSQRLQYL